MGTVIFLLGVRGAGKTTALTSLQTKQGVIILKPSTTRARRHAGENEYHFTSNWNSSDYAWEISIGSEKYGMLKTELARADHADYAVTVFDPSNIETLKQFRKDTEYSTYTVGLDTINTASEQASRVSGNASRTMSDNEFITQRDIIKDCDIVLQGNESTISNAISSILDCLKSGGGILKRPTIEKFLAANLLLEGTQTKNISTASYDLALGDDIWCQGKFITLDDKNLFLKIPPYSYAIVSAKELANLPNFVAARFDLANSLFFQGIILSNGPQVDPGFRGALFCMLYNGRDEPVALKRGEHFSTIEFITTSGSGPGYKGKYQNKRKLSDFMPAHAVASKGGEILERTENKIDKIDTQWKFFLGASIAVVAVIMALLIPVLFFSYDVITKWSVIKSEMQEYSDIEERMESLEEKLYQSNKNPTSFKGTIPNGTPIPVKELYGPYRP